MTEHGILIYDLAGNWCEECGRAKSFRLFPGTLTGCSLCDEVITRHRCTSRPPIEDLADGESWECPDCGSIWTPRTEERDCSDCCGECGHQVTARTWDSEEGDRIDTAPRHEPLPWTPFRNALRKTADALITPPFRNQNPGPGSCYQMASGPMVHIRPGCRCKLPRAGLALQPPVHHHFRMASEEACPGTCNRGYREARELFKQALADYDPLDANQSRPIPPSIQAWPGDPWCGRCKSRIRETLAELDDLAALLMATADGHRAGPGTERVSGSAETLSPSQAGDDLHELETMLAGWEGAYRELMEWPSLTRRGHLASAVTTCIAWLSARLDEVLVAPFAVDFGAEVMQWHREFTNKTKAGARTLRKPLRCPRPHCRLLTLTWTEGDTYVTCNNPDCGARIPLAEYEAETLRLSEALERGELEAEVA